MIYERLDEIPLARFVDVYLGDIDRVTDGKGRHSEAEKREAAGKLCSRYVQIVGGRAVSVRISRRNELLKREMRLTVLQSCRRLMGVGCWEGVGDILSGLGYRLDAGDKEGLRRKVEQVEATERYMLDKLMKEARQMDESGERMKREDFTKERVAVMSHVKMYIDPETFSAEDYAWMVRNMCDELDAAMKRSKTTKKKR